MDLFSNLGLGFGVALSFSSLSYALIGCLLGTMIGILPGLGPLATISMLLPFTFGLDPLSALIMLAGIYYGAAYGGSTTAILVNMPGETSSAVTVLDGFQMAQRGRAGVAIATAAIASFAAGCFGTLILAIFVEPLASVAYRFGGAEYFSLILAGLVAAVSIAAGSVPRAIGMILIGICLSTVGTDLNSGVMRFTFGLPHLWDGIDFIVLAVGLFAICEVICVLDERAKTKQQAVALTSLMPGRGDFRRMAPSIARGSMIGSLLGVLPGAGLSLASFFAYAVEKRSSRYKHEIGHGAIEGVAAPEAANNAAAQTAFIPTLGLGIPGSPTMALMLGAMVMYNIQPGPQVMVRNPELFWGLIASMWIGNLMLVVLNLPLVGVWVQLLRVPYRNLFLGILLFCGIGAYSVANSWIDVAFAAGFGVLGYVFRKLGCEPAPLLLGFVLGPMLEDNFRRAMVLSEGNPMVFVESPISLGFLILALVVLVISCLPSISDRRETLAED